MKNKRLGILIVMFALLLQPTTSNANKENVDRVIGIFGGNAEPEKIKDKEARLTECSNLNEKFKAKAQKFNKSQAKTQEATQNLKSLENKYRKASKEIDKYSETYEICEEKYNPYGNGIPKRDNVSERCNFVRIKTNSAIESLQKSRAQYDEIMRENKPFYDEQKALFSRLKEIEEKMIVNNCPQLKN